uniref:Uncharacterized protein n=1 Tax=Oryza sativa subsp. japonica TaxID=39947 RepID=Q5VME6_ORYSJ|nr:hypothetical protein [Oryza sativa Japonica Group]
MKAVEERTESGGDSKKGERECAHCLVGVAAAMSGEGGRGERHRRWSRSALPMLPLLRGWRGRVDLAGQLPSSP